MNISSQTHGNTFRLFLSGNFDVDGSSAVESALEKALFNDSSTIVLNMTGVKYITSIGIRVLMLAYKQAIKNGKNIFIEGMSDKVKEVLDITGIMPLFKVR